MLVSRRDIAIRRTNPQCAEGNFGALLILRRAFPRGRWSGGCNPLEE
jgi:hypothetical protein